SGWTSHDVVARTRRLLGTRRVGHAGTLDPLAEGVLPLAVGRATRLVEWLAAGDKDYFAVLTLGVRTETDDAEGAVIAERPVPPLSTARLGGLLQGFEGVQRQTPPAFSAIKVGGLRAYSLARRGRTPTLAAREVTIHSLRLCWW